MKKVISVFLVAAMIVVSTACQPTPEEEYVTHRDADLIEEKLQAGNPASEEAEAEEETVKSYKEYVEAYKASLPTHWSETIEAGKGFTFTIDANIKVNNEDSFPVYTISHTSFDTEHMEVIANNFFKDVTGIREGSKPLKEEYSAAISSLNERDMATFAQDAFREMQGAPGGGYTDTDHITLRNEISQYQIVRQRDGSIGRIDISYGYGLGDCLTYDTNQRGIVYVMDRYLVDDGAYDGEGPITVNIPITQEQAEETLKIFLQKNDLEDFTVASVTEGRHFDLLYMQEISQGWRFVLLRTNGYCAVNTSDTSGGKDALLKFEEDTQYSRPWLRETIVVYVSENGVERFDWNYPIGVTGIAAENVELLDFAEIQNNARNLLTAGMAWMETEFWEAEIKKVELTVMAQQAKNDGTKAYLMPVWVLYIDWYFDDDFASTTLLALNALNGSRAIIYQ